MFGHSLTATSARQYWLHPDGRRYQYTPRFGRWEMLPDWPHELFVVLTNGFDFTVQAQHFDLAEDFHTRILLTEWDEKATKYWSHLPDTVSPAKVAIPPDDLECIFDLTLVCLIDVTKAHIEPPV